MVLVGLVIDNRLLESKGPRRGPGGERARHENAHTMVGVGMDDAWRANEFPQHHYVTIILIYQVIYFVGGSICVFVLLIWIRFTQRPA